jgi:HEAT repeat protein
MKKFAVLLILVSLTTNFSVAQKNNEQINLNSNAKNNLIIALNSDNAGLKRSAVYFAGYYKIQETVESLADLLESSSTDMSLKTIAAYSLHQIGDDECLDALKEAADDGADKHLCSKCKLMYENLMQIKAGITYQ